MSLPEVSSFDENSTSYNREALFAGTVMRMLAPVAEYIEGEKSGGVSEVMINGPKDIYVEESGVIEKVSARFEDEEALLAAARSISQYSGKPMTPHTLSIEARLPNQSRVHIVQDPAARNGLCISIRRFQKVNMGTEDLVKNGSIAPDVAEFLKICIGLRKNIVISGGTSTGKTTFLNALTEAMEEDERIIVIEDVNELDVRRDHVVYFEAQKPDRFGYGGISIRELFRASLRMRPDRILVGECRGGEALDMVQAMTSGHSGSITTLHANTSLDALQRLETMCLMSDIALPQIPLRQQIVQAVDIVVQLERLHSTKQRGIVQLSEVIGLGSLGEYVLKDVFKKTPAVQTRKDAKDTTPLTQMTDHKVKFRSDGGFLFEAKEFSLTKRLWS